MSSHTDPIRDVKVITTGDGEVHHEHAHGTRNPELVWVFIGRRWLRLPSNVYVLGHTDGLVLFDTGQDRDVVTHLEPCALAESTDLTETRWPDPRRSQATGEREEHW